MNHARFWNHATTAAVIGTVTVIVGSLGVADASNGGSLTLGHQNTATKTTTLKDTHGTPLALVGSKAKPPLKVNSSVEVEHLNANLLDGASASGLVTSGSGASNAPYSATPITSMDMSNAVLVAQTGTLVRGTYFLNAWAEMSTSGTNVGSICFVGPDADQDDDGGGPVGRVHAGYGNPTVEQVVTVTTPEKLGYYCYGTDTSLYVLGATITAIRVAHFTPGSAVQPSTAK